MRGVKINFTFKRADKKQISAAIKGQDFKNKFTVLNLTFTLRM